MRVSSRRIGGTMKNVLKSELGEDIIRKGDLTTCMGV